MQKSQQKKSEIKNPNHWVPGENLYKKESKLVFEFFATYFSTKCSYRHQSSLPVGLCSEIVIQNGQKHVFWKFCRRCVLLNTWFVEGCNRFHSIPTHKKSSLVQSNWSYEWWIVTTRNQLPTTLQLLVRHSGFKWFLCTQSLRYPREIEKPLRFSATRLIIRANYVILRSANMMEACADPH